MNESIIQEKSGINQFFAKIYGLVALGIGLSAVVSYLMMTVFFSHLYIVLTGSSLYIYMVMLAELALVIFASQQASKNGPLALPLFLTYSVLNGYTLSFVLIMYTGGTIVNAFLASSLMFLVLSALGVTTRRDLSAMGQAFRAGLIGVIIASLLNLWMQSDLMSYVISVVSVVIFSGLIAYDNQRMRHIYEQTNGQVPKGWVVSLALSLYLDFINLFLKILRLMGRSRN